MDDIEYRAFTPELVIRAADGGDYDGRIIEGIAVPYNKPQRIDDQLTEVFVPGAFAHQIAAAPRVKLTRGHMSRDGEVIGRALELREQKNGLWGAFLVSRTPMGAATLELVRDGALDELSIGFTQPRNGARTLPSGVVERTKANLFEVAVVLQGAYGRGARVLATRADTDDPPVPAPGGESDEDIARRVETAKLRDHLAALKQFDVRTGQMVTAGHAPG